MDLKPTIFIGSSTENYDIAEKIAMLLNDIAECKLWKEAFDYGKSSYDSLITQISFHDYAILIAGANDILISRHQVFDSPRDNVLFEFGLFIGGLGKSRVFYLVQEGTKIPTDLSGITLPFFPAKTDAGFDLQIEACVAKIKKHIIGKENTHDLGFLPSTALAYGYFTNFVERTVERLLEDKAAAKTFHLENGVAFKISILKFSILIPDDLTSDMFKKVKAKRLKDGWQKLKVDPKDVRDYDFSIDITKTAHGELHLVDIPFTLNALHMSLELYSQKEHIGKDDKENLIEYREIRHFKKMLDYLIKTSALTEGIVDTEIVHI